LIAKDAHREPNPQDKGDSNEKIFTCINRSIFYGTSI
jgi:hypothetical protein